MRLAHLSFLAAVAFVACSSATPAEPTTPPALTDDGGATPANEAGVTSDGGSGEAGHHHPTTDSTIPPSGECTYYCTKIMKVCTGQFQPYQTMAGCLRACSILPLGTPDQYNGNSGWCRIRHAEACESYPEFASGHCLHGGAYGYAGCGEPCEGFCDLAMGWCGTRPGGGPYASHAACMAECYVFENAPAPTPGGTVYSANGPPSGDSIDCREYYLTASLESEAMRDALCPNVATNSPMCK